MTEYLIILAIIAVIAIGVTGLFGKQIKATFTRSNKALAGDTSGANSETKDNREKAETTDAMGTFDVAHEGRSSIARASYKKKQGGSDKSFNTQYRENVSAFFGWTFAAWVWVLYNCLSNLQFAFGNGGARSLWGLVGSVGGTPWLPTIFSVTDPNLSFALGFFPTGLALFGPVLINHTSTCLGRLRTMQWQAETKHSKRKALQAKSEALRKRALKPRMTALKARMQACEARREAHKTESKAINDESKAIDDERTALDAETKALA